MKLLLKYLGYFGIVASTAGSVYAFHLWSKARGAKEVKEISYEGKIDKLMKSDSLKTITLQELRTNQAEILYKTEEVIEKQEEAKGAFNALRLVVINHQATTIEEFKKLIQDVPELKRSMQIEASSEVVRQAPNSKPGVKIR